MLKLKLMLTQPPTELELELGLSLATGYLLHICMIVRWYLRDIAKLSSSGQVVIKLNLN